MNYSTNTKCRSCGGAVGEILSFDTPLAGGFLEPGESAQIYPLTLVFCSECKLTQIAESIPPATLFARYYYKTGDNPTLVKHFKSLAESLEENTNIPTDSILEIGCNDMTFLKNFTDGRTLVGVDPSDVSRGDNVDGVVLCNEYFGEVVAESVLAEHGEFGLITSSNNFAHIDDINDAATGVSTLLRDDGVFVIEVHPLSTIINNNQFPMIYHEHIFYYTLHSLGVLLKRHGIEVFDVCPTPLHGGSMRVFADRGIRGKTPEVEKWLAGEVNMNDIAYLQEFSKRMSTSKDEVFEFLEGCQKNGDVVAGYGASGQANTLMAFMGITNEHIEYIVDDSPRKVGLRTPNGIPIMAPSELGNTPPDQILVLAYTFAESIIARYPEHDNWVIPLPELKTYGR